MWNYYGSKSKVAKYYPEPRHDLIIEPFAGTARYSELYADRDVLLNEKNPIVYQIWDWLLNHAEPQNILDYLSFSAGDDIRDILPPGPHRDLVGFCINRGVSSPCNIVQKWSCQSKKNPNWASTVEYRLKKIAKALPQIKHWKISFGDYKNIPNQEATWFIDPPYQKGGEHYPTNDVDYSELAEWCRSRYGQVIVCENQGAEWMDFSPLVIQNGQRRQTTEVMWTRDQ